MRKQIATAVLYFALSGSAWAVNPVITSITPNNGPDTGGACVMAIRGAFTLPITSISIGAFGNVTISASAIGRIDISAIPAGAVGAFNVTVIDAGGTTIVPNGFNYVNNQMQIVLTSAIVSVVDISWGPSTVVDSNNNARAGTVLPYTWVAASASHLDAPTAAASLGAVYTMSDDYVVTIKNNGTGTTTTIILTATCSNAASGAWTNNGAGGPGTNLFEMRGRVGLAGTLLPIPIAASGIFQSGGVNATIAPASETQIDLLYSSPTKITAGADVQQSITVVFTAQHS